MQHFLGMGNEDRCLGFFIVAASDPDDSKDRRAREPQIHLAVEWRK
jgi:hypothetical protein